MQGFARREFKLVLALEAAARSEHAARLLMLTRVPSKDGIEDDLPLWCSEASKLQEAKSAHGRAQGGWLAEAFEAPAALIDWPDAHAEASWGRSADEAV